MERLRSSPSRSPQEIDVVLPPSSTFRDASVSSDRKLLCPPHEPADGQRLRSPIENRFRSSPAGDPFQAVENESRLIPETRLESLVPLAKYFDAWKNLANISPWALRTIQYGYRLQFGFHPPRFNGVVWTVVNPTQGRVLEQEVNSLLAKGAIEHIPPLDRESGFYSRYFIVPKKDGGLRPIIDLRYLNRSLFP